ncbi:Hypothetical protein DEACI_0970 [Acididesulfobacillus acetoxydans]|uniref:Uncharacterized protein n=1 Tax=Acididesulfobacillus acetoxydans TaxID=1561005 RepID=A0A8S0XVG7_9FIRM|nr:Hypothetical protein DEACI_0970 [Acididesulfobacillus acetoxydans]CEJ06093.1 Hypothetical protein DEACI_0539 [Acididesulfobacillus acetoxydans]
MLIALSSSRSRFSKGRPPAVGGNDLGAIVLLRVVTAPDTCGGEIVVTVKR